LPAVLAEQAKKYPEKTYLAERRGGPQADWYHASYAEVYRQSRSVAAWLLSQNIPNNRPVLILSGNSILHAVVKYGAMMARIPACPVSVQYSLAPGDFGRLKHVVDMLRPAVVFAEATTVFRRALETVNFADALLVTDDPSQLHGLTSTTQSVATGELLSMVETPDLKNQVDASIAAINPEDAALYMLTSGSTSKPKAVIQTLRMLTANITQACQVLGDAVGWGDVVIEWLPWSHVSGAVPKMCVLYSGGTLFIDGGKPVPGLFAESLQNLREIKPRSYINVPFGYAMLIDALEQDADLRQDFFSHLRLALYGGAGLSQALYERFQRLAVQTIGERIFFTTAYGMTETTSGCMSIYFPTEEVGIGLPMPGLTLKLVRNADRYEVRLKGPMITPGYLGQAQENARLFDEEGFFLTGDAAEWHDPTDIQQGLKFAGRLTEEFKLTNGTWVRAGHLRTLLLEAFAPLVSDLLLCGENRDYLAVLVWPKAPIDETHRAELAARLAAFNAGRGSSERIKVLGLLTDPPSVEGHEVTDKGTVNQRVALARRAAHVEELYAQNGVSPHLIYPSSNS
jgi:feruloyl-CoA synthase